MIILNQPKFCPKCGTETKSKASTCLNCGFDFNLKSKSKKEEKITSTAQEEVSKQEEYPFSNVTTRVQAYILDFLILSILFIFFEYLFSTTRYTFSFPSGGEIIIEVLIGIFFGLTSFLYFFGFEYYNNGKTLGKRVMHIKTVKINGNNGNLKDHLLNNVSKVIIFIPLSGIPFIRDIFSNNLLLRIASIYFLFPYVIYLLFPLLIIVDLIGGGLMKSQDVNKNYLRALQKISKMNVIREDKNNNFFSIFFLLGLTWIIIKGIFALDKLGLLFYGV